MRCVLQGQQGGGADIYQMFADQILSLTAQGSIRPDYRNPRSFQPDAGKDYLVIAGLGNTWYLALTNGVNVVKQVLMMCDAVNLKWSAVNNPPYPRIGKYSETYVGYCSSEGNATQTYGALIAFEI